MAGGGQHNAKAAGSLPSLAQCPASRMLACSRGKQQLWVRSASPAQKTRALAIPGPWQRGREGVRPFASVPRLWHGSSASWNGARGHLLTLRRSLGQLEPAQC